MEVPDWWIILISLMNLIALVFVIKLLWGGKGERKVPPKGPRKKDKE